MTHSPVDDTRSPYSPPSQPSSSSVLSMVPSPPASTTNIRYEVILEAPTAAAQKAEESPLTYLNKGQFYNIVLKDTEAWDGMLTSTVVIMFHDEDHRKVAPNYWKFWLSQQKNAQTARAIDLDVGRSNGVQQIECAYFDRISFQWNGKQGACINIRFNCLSTDFSRIKGVKGIPLRLHMETTALSGSQLVAEKTYCRIKLFRDKGAERKNKDDAKHIERQLEKLRGKHGESHPLWLSFSQTQPYTVFREVPSSPAAAPPVPLAVVTSLAATSSSSMATEQQQQQQPHPQSHHSLDILHHPHRLMVPLSNTSDVALRSASASASSASTMISAGVASHSGALNDPSSLTSVTLPPPLMSLRGLKRPPYTDTNLSSAPSPAGSGVYLHGPVDIDVDYVPQRRRRTAKLCLFVRFGASDVHRAIYLDQLTLQDLVDKVSAKMELSSEIKDVVRHVANKEAIVVHVDDAVLQDMPEEQDMEIDTKTNDDGSLTLILRY